MQSLLLRLEADIAARKRPPTIELRRTIRPLLLAALLMAVGYRFGADAAESRGWSGGPHADGRLRTLQEQLDAREGEIALQKAYIERLERVHRNSARYGIDAELAAQIEDIALAENISPKVAFELVRVESGFNRHAVSPVGAVGLTQLMPSTARLLAPNVTRAQLFERETNLRIGFRFFRQLLNHYNGDVRLALHAYNRGPGIVDRLLSEGRDPSNGYAKLVLGH
jgi:soluble lytic murein transglycosylase-like protein